MPRGKSPTLTEAELRLMQVLWKQGEGTVGDVAKALPKSSQLAYSSVLTTLRILEQKGYVEHRKEGRAFVYRPLVEQAAARRSAVRYVVSRFFDNSAELLLLNVLESEDLSPQEMKRLRKMIEEGE